MSRLDDDDGDEPLNHSATNKVILLLIAIVFGAGLLVVGGVTLGVYGYMWYAEAQAADEAQAQADAVAEAHARAEAAAAAAGITAKPPPISREVFRAKVMGKTAEEVVKELGHPDLTNDPFGQLQSPVWHYWSRSFDPANKKTDSNATLTIEDGKVTGVEFVDGS
jgi:hypothetical protein